MQMSGGGARVSAGLIGKRGMAKSTRMFEIIQILRGAKAPMTADTLAERLEVSTRTIYRDIAALQAMRTPIEGESGIGYIMRRGYDLPPETALSKPQRPASMTRSRIYTVPQNGCRSAHGECPTTIPQRAASPGHPCARPYAPRAN